MQIFFIRIVSKENLIHFCLMQLTHAVQMTAKRNDAQQLTRPAIRGKLRKDR